MILITAPATPVVPLADLKAHLRVDGPDEDALITSLEAAAVAYLDGWKGVLGRCIKQQTWRDTVAEWGNYTLPFPDVSAVAVTYQIGNAAEVAAPTAILRDGYVEIDGPAADRIYINMTCAMSAAHLNTAQMIVRLIVAAWFNNRAQSDIPPAAHALISAIRWGRV